MTEDRSKILESAIAQMEKQFGKGSIMRLGSRDVLVPVSVIPSGSIAWTRRWVSVDFRADAWWRSSDRSPAARPRWRCT